MVDVKSLKELTKELSVLYVEDKFDIRKNIENILRIFFREVYSAENGEVGLNLFNTESVDMIITDIRMPIMDGLEMISEIKKIDRDIPIIITTAFNDTDYFMKSIELGVDKYIIKPIDKEITLNTLYSVSTLINDRKKAKEYEQKLLQEKIEKSTTFALKEITDAYPNPSILFEGNEIKFINLAFKEMVEETFLEKLFSKEITLSELFIKRDGFLNDLNDIDEDISKNRVLIKAKNEEKIYLIILKNLILNESENRLYTFNDITLSENQKEKIKELNELAIALTFEKDLDKLLEMILSDARKFTLADGGTLYLKDKSKLYFRVVQNETLNIFKNKKDEINWKPIELFDENGKSNINILSANSALNGKVINIKDVYSDEKFDFIGVKNFDKSANYLTKSILTVPMKTQEGEVIGVLQLINKKEKSELSSFTQDDEEIALSLASQIVVAISKMKQEKLLIKQSKMAAIGEMVDAVAHQWKQPLSILSLYALDLPFQFETGEVNLEYAKYTSEKILFQIKHLTNTLEEFRSFFRPNKEKVLFSILDIINSTLLLVKDDFIKNKIEVDVFGDREVKMCGFSNEYKHVILNIINNSRDAFNEKDIKNRKIIFEIIDDEDIILNISDNAGGVKKEVLPNIFDSNFTTKDEEKGSGVGLYMSKLIIYNMGGEIYAKNIKDENSNIIGVKFTIKTPKSEC